MIFDTNWIGKTRVKWYFAISKYIITILLMGNTDFLTIFLKIIILVDFWFQNDKCWWIYRDSIFLTWNLMITVVLILKTTYISFVILNIFINLIIGRIKFSSSSCIHRTIVYLHQPQKHHLLYKDRYIPVYMLIIREWPLKTLTDCFEKNKTQLIRRKNRRLGI